MASQEPEGVVVGLFDGSKYIEGGKSNVMVIDEIHPDLPEDWDVHKGCTSILEALLGQHGLPQQKIAEMGVQLISLLLTKNQRYGDAALNPLRIFARGLSPIDLIHVRMDDKLSRLARGNQDNGDGESPIFDLGGYCVLELIASWEERQEGGKGA